MDSTERLSGDCARLAGRSWRHLFLQSTGASHRKAYSERPLNGLGRLDRLFLCPSRGAVPGCEKEDAMFFLFVVCFLFLVSPTIAAAENQTWTVRPGDNLEIISTTLEIPKEEIKKSNPDVLETNLQIGQKLKLPFVSFAESKRLERVLREREARIVQLESDSGGLEKKVASAEAQLFWYPVWLWGFWFCFAIISFIVGGAYWIFRQTHPRVFDEQHERSIIDLKDSQTRRSSFHEQGAGSRGGQWRPPLKHLPHGR